MEALKWLLFAFGYPVAIVVIVRWVPVVRERRTRWFALHELAVAAIVAGQAIRGEPLGIIVNASWGVIAAVWYAAGPAINRRRSPSELSPAPD
jgi:hypothetical protein